MIGKGVVIVVRASPESSTDVFKEFGRSLFLTSFTVISRVYLAAMLVYLPLRYGLGDRFWLLAFINNFAIYFFLPLLIILPLGLALRRRWVIIWSVLLTVIAVVWVGPYFIPKRPAPPAGPTLGVVTLDVDLSNLDLTGVKNWMLETNADVILLQRVNTFLIRKGQLSGSSIRYPFQHGVFFSDVPWGNFILSRYPIRKIDKLEIERGPSIGMQQRYEIDVNGQIIAVYNVNFAYPITPDGLPRIRIPGNSPLLQAILTYDPVMRDNQIREFLSLLQNETQPYLVAGDFNMSDQTQIYGDIARQMRDSFREAGFGLGATWPLTPGDGLIARLTSPLFRVDYIWHGGGLRTVNVGQGPRGLGSDHLPVYATLELTGQ
jgi:vancomycin resistance protein VanJ